MANNNHYFSSNRINYEFPTFPNSKILDDENELTDSYIDYEGQKRNYRGQLTQKIRGERIMNNTILRDNLINDLSVNQYVKETVDSLVSYLFTKLLSELCMDCDEIRDMEIYPEKYKNISRDKIKDIVLGYLKDQFYINHFNINGNVVGSILVNNMEDTSLDNILVRCSEIMSITISNYIDEKGKENSEEDNPDDSGSGDIDDTDDKGSGSDDNADSDTDISDDSENIPEVINISKQDLIADKDDNSNAIVADGIEGKVDDVTIKSIVDTDNEEVADTAGINAAILVRRGGNINVHNTIITTTGTHAHGLFVCDPKSRIEASEDTITTSGEAASGMVVYSEIYGYTDNYPIIEATNLDITTEGDYAPVMQSLGTLGTIIVANGHYSSEGKGSPIISAKSGKVYITSATMIANHAQIAELYGENAFVNIDGCSMIANDETLDFETNYHAAFIMNTGINDSKNKSAVLEINSSNIINNNGAIFYAQRVDGNVTLTNTTIDQRSINQMFAVASKESRLSINCYDQMINNDIYVDTYSKITLNLNNGSHFKGHVWGSGDLFINTDDTSTYEILPNR